MYYSCNTYCSATEKDIKKFHEFMQDYDENMRMLQKIFTKDFMTGKKSKNIGQRNRYYVKDSHPAIVTAEVFDKVQEEMSKRARLVHKEDGTVESTGSKYNGKYLLENLLVCGDCGVSYRGRRN